MRVRIFLSRLSYRRHIGDIRIMPIKFALYPTLRFSGYLLSYLFQNPWLLLISLYLAPVLRFGSFKSFSLGICDCTFNAEDGGLHMALGLFGYLLTLPFVAIEMLQGKYYQGDGSFLGQTLWVIRTRVVCLGTTVLKLFSRN